MNKERLLRLADWMDGVKPEKFDISVWASDSINPKLVDQNWNAETGEVALEGFCGTVCCVLGHACFIPEFRKDGLTIKKTVGKFDDDDVSWSPEFKGSFDSIAGAEFFELTQQHANIIFGLSTYSWIFYGEPCRNIGPKKVASALRKYVETDGESMAEIFK